MIERRKEFKKKYGNNSDPASPISDQLKIFYLMNTRMPTRRSSSLQVMYTCNGLANRGNSVKLFIRSENASEYSIDDIFEFYGMEKTFGIQRIPTINWTRRTQTWSFVLLVLPYILFDMLKSGRPDLVYIRGVAIAWTFLIASRILKINVFYETQELGSEVASKVHDLVAIEEKKSESFLRRLSLVEAFIFGNVDGIVVGTENLKQAIIRLGFPECRIRIIPDGFDPERFRIRRRTENAEIDLDFRGEGSLIGYIGHLYYWKGVDSLIEAMSLVVKEFPDVRLLIVGGLEDEPDIERLKRLAKDRDLSGNVIFTGYVQPDEVPYYLDLAEILVIPTLDTIMGKYAMPMKIFEYMAAEKAIIASDLDAHRQILRDEETALLVPPGNPKSMANAIESLLKNKRLARDLATRAKSRAYENFTWEHRAWRIEEFYKEVITNRQHRQSS